MALTFGDAPAAPTLSFGAPGAGAEAASSPPTLPPLPQDDPDEKVEQAQGSGAAPTLSFGSGAALSFGPGAAAPALPPTPDKQDQVAAVTAQAARAEISNLGLPMGDLVENEGEAQVETLVEEPAGVDETATGGAAAGATQIKTKAAPYRHPSVDAFDKLPLSPELLKGIAKMGFTNPSKIQGEALPYTLQPNQEGGWNNMIGQAHHGSGKTVTFTLSMLGRADPRQDHVQCICLCHTRELVYQIAGVTEELAAYTQIKVYKALAKTRLPRRINAQILVGTPGKLNECVRRRVFDSRAVKMMVVDEADELLRGTTARELGGQTITIRNALPRGCQVLLFSATFPKEVRAFALKVAPNPIVIKLKKQDLTLEGIQQYEVVCNNSSEKFSVLHFITGLVGFGQLLIFVNRIDTAKVLYKQLRDNGYTGGVIYGRGMPVDLRDKVMDQFRTGATMCLVTTDVLARGIDVLAINIVINYDIPVDKNQRPNPQQYMHRIGRSGRYGRKGIALNLVTKGGNDQKDLQEIADHYRICTKRRAEEMGNNEQAIKGKYTNATGVYARMHQLDGTSEESLNDTVEKYLAAEVE